MQTEDTPSAETPTTVQTDTTAIQPVKGIQIKQKVPLCLILLFAAFLNLFRLWQVSYGNTYYAAGVKSMLTSWPNFFFVSFDPGGFITIDKPPLGFWIQAVSAKIFGVNGLGLLLPEALAGIASVAVLYYLIRRSFGSNAALLAALALAITPISVVASHNNTIDSLLVLTLLLATYAISRAAEMGRLRWLLLAACLIGLGFNIKMLEAYLVIPAFGLMYLLGAPVRWYKRVLHLLLATILLLAISLSWIVTVDLIPTSQRPYVGSTSTNSELALALGYNGVERLLGVNYAAKPTNHNNNTHTSAHNHPRQRRPPPHQQFNIFDGRGPGPLRLLDDPLSGQIGWLLPLALLGLLAACWHTHPHLPLNRKQQAIVLWGIEFLTMSIFFSMAQFLAHSYYLSMLAPSVCALVGIGSAIMWNEYRHPGWRGWLLPIALLITAAIQVWILHPSSVWGRWLTLLIVGLTLLAAVSLVILRHFSLRSSRAKQTPDSSQQATRQFAGMQFPCPKKSYIPMLVATLGILALLLAPAIWSSVTVMQRGNTLLEGAGPLPGPIIPSFKTLSKLPNQQLGDIKLLHYLQSHQGHTRFLLATLSTGTAAPFILATNEPVMALGGFSGGDPVLTTQQLVEQINHNTIRFFLLNANPPKTLPQGPRAKLSRNSPSVDLETRSNTNLVTWVSTHCPLVPPSQWQTGSPQKGSNGRTPQRLFDCATH